MCKRCPLVADELDFFKRQPCRGKCLEAPVEPPKPSCLDAKLSGVAAEAAAAEPATGMDGKTQQAPKDQAPAAASQQKAEVPPATGHEKPAEAPALTSHEKPVPAPTSHEKTEVPAPTSHEKPEVPALTSHEKPAEVPAPTSHEKPAEANKSREARSSTRNKSREARSSTRKPEAAPANQANNESR